jgi:hypothetical protein
MSIRDELARIVWGTANPGIDAEQFTPASWADRAADAILARYAVIELPEPDYHGCWPAGARARVTLTREGRITDGYAIRETPDEARALAAALLAAANRAEAQS